MLAFCGQERCLLDGSGRLKLAPRWIEDFLARGNGEVVIHGLPEGALALYPMEIYSGMRREALAQLDRAASSFAARRSMRRFGALTAETVITRQGRITVPPAFRDYAALEPGTEIHVIGVEIGIELWNTGRYRAEMDEIQSHYLARGANEMSAELIRPLEE